MFFRQRCFSITTKFESVVFLCAALACVALTACSTQGVNWDPDDYTVKSGDTLYSIAWRYEIDPEQLSAWNNIDSSNLIKAGQRIHTRRPANFNASKPTERVSPSDRNKWRPRSAPKSDSYYKNAQSIKARKGDSLYAISKRSNVSVARLAQLNQLKKPYTIQPGQTIFLKPLPSRKTKSTSSKTGNTQAKTGSTRSTGSKTPTRTSSVAKSSGMSWPRTVRWLRPANGKVIKKFSRQRNGSKGIDIAGKLGNKIVAAADGKVVYSGNGLISYGNLIIIKHNKTYLSAYAYNRKLLVKEGVMVKAGQKIAEMGRKDKLSPRLHFEIRKNGKSVDPLKYIKSL